MRNAVPHWRHELRQVIMTGPADLTFGGELGINAIKEQTAALGKTDALGRQSEDRRVVHDLI